LKPDGTLELDEKPGLPPGRVRVTLEAQAAQSREDVWTVLERIRAERKARGMQGRSRAEIGAEINVLRDEWHEGGARIMNTAKIVVQGAIKPDGSLELAERLSLPPGPVQITIQPMPAAPPGQEDWWQFLQRARAELEAMG